MAIALKSVHEPAYADSDRRVHDTLTVDKWEGSDDFVKILRENEDHVWRRVRTREAGEKPVRSPHLLLLAIASMAVLILSVMMILDGTALASGFPLSAAALALVSFGLFAGALAELRSKRARM